MATRLGNWIKEQVQQVKDNLEQGRAATISQVKEESVLGKVLVTVNKVAPVVAVAALGAGIIKSIIPDNTAVPTNGAVANTKASAEIVGGKSEVAGGGPIPANIGIAQQSAAPVQAVGQNVQVPVNSSGLGIFTQEIPPVAATSKGVLMNGTGIVGQAVGQVAGSLLANLLPTSQAMTGVEATSEYGAMRGNMPTNPSNTDGVAGETKVGVLITIAILAIVAFLFKRIFAK